MNNAPDWYLDMPIIGHGPGLFLTAGLLWMCWQLFVVTRDDNRRRRRKAGR